VYEDPHKTGRKLFLHYGDLANGSYLSRLLGKINPHEIYNLGAQSHVRVSFDIPEYTADIVALGPVRILESIRESGIKPKYYQASSSEMFGGVSVEPLNEESLFSPRSPYAASKLFGYWITRNYREAYGIHATNGILFNHESPRRGPTFVTRKITMALARIMAGRQKKLYLGNLDAKRDWGYAPEYMEAAWMMLQQKDPDDYVVATGETHSVQEFLEEAFTLAKLNWKDYVEKDVRYLRPTEVDVLLGDPSKAYKKLGWKPKTTFKEIVRIMLESDCTAEGVQLPV
jgi:GDPmannose 4,6-dehydratase